MLGNQKIHLTTLLPYPLSCAGGLALNHLVSQVCLDVVNNNFEHQSLFVLFSSFFRIPGCLLGVKISKKKAKSYSFLRMFTVQ